MADCVADKSEEHQAETGKRGMTPFLPPVVPFGSKQWPTLVTPGPGPATIADLK